ncbi:MAG TPA: hypothetical protein VNR51_05830 [Hyphomicrobium sp.]|nr:hypothetical protein [Hyphomicrobium sp.]
MLVCKCCAPLDCGIAFAACGAANIIAPAAKAANMAVVFIDLSSDLHGSNGTARAWFRAKYAIRKPKSPLARNCRGMEPDAVSLPHCTYLFGAHSRSFLPSAFLSTFSFQGAAQ